MTSKGSRKIVKPALSAARDRNTHQQRRLRGIAKKGNLAGSRLGR